MKNTGIALLCSMVLTIPGLALAMGKGKSVNAFSISGTSDSRLEVHTIFRGTRNDIICEPPFADAPRRSHIDATDGGDFSFDVKLDRYKSRHCRYALESLYLQIVPDYENDVNFPNLGGEPYYLIPLQENDTRAERVVSITCFLQAAPVTTAGVSVTEDMCRVELEDALAQRHSEMLGGRFGTRPLYYSRLHPEYFSGIVVTALPAPPLSFLSRALSVVTSRASIDIYANGHGEAGAGSALVLDRAVPELGLAARAYRIGSRGSQYSSEDPDSTMRFQGVIGRTDEIYREFELVLHSNRARLLTRFGKCDIRDHEDFDSALIVEKLERVSGRFLPEVLSRRVWCFRKNQ